MDKQEQTGIKIVANGAKAKYVENADAEFSFMSDRALLMSSTGAKLVEFLKEQHLEAKCHRCSIVGVCGSRVVRVAFKTQSIN